MQNDGYELNFVVRTPCKQLTQTYTISFDDGKELSIVCASCKCEDLIRDSFSGELYCSLCASKELIVDK